MVRGRHGRLRILLRLPASEACLRRPGLRRASGAPPADHTRPRARLLAGEARASFAITALIACLALAALFPSAGCGPSPREVAWDPDSIPDAFSQASAALFWPGLTRSFLVDSGGTLINGLWEARFAASADGVPAPGPARIAYEQRWCPVVRWTRHNGDVRWEFEAVAFPARSSVDSVMLVSLRVRTVNSGAAAHHVRLAATLDSMARPPRFVAPDGDTPAPRILAWTRGGRDSACGWSDATAEGAAAVLDATLAPGATRIVRFLLPTHPLPGSDLADCARTAHEGRVAVVRLDWTEQVRRGTRFQLNDPEVETALRAATVVLLGCRERWGGMWYPIGGPFHYRDTWLRDGARLISALAITNHTEEARALTDGIASLQWPQGAFLTQRGQLDGTGQALWTFEQAALRPQPDTSVARLAAQALKACQWSEWQRQLGRSTGWPYGRMLPFGDPHDGELAQAQLVGNDLWMLAGYRATARLCGAAGMKSDSAQVETWRRSYAQDFADALARRGARDVPPCWQGEGRDWGNLTAAWPAGVLAPDDPRCERLARRVWGVVGGPGFLSYGDRDSLQSYVGADLGTWAMLADRPETADSVLAATLEWRNASGAGAELFSAKTRDYGWNLPPHPTSAAALVALVRNAMIFDDRDTLALTLAARDRWWTGATVRGAPTRWGVLDLSFRRDGDRARWTWTPVPVWTLLHLPRGAALSGAAAAPLVATANPHVVLAPPGTSSAEVRLAAAR